jgi:hypothetical protein
MIPKMKKDRRTRDQETECQNNARNEGQNVCICIWDEKRDKVDSADRASDEKQEKHNDPYRRMVTSPEFKDLRALSFTDEIMLSRSEKPRTWRLEEEAARYFFETRFVVTDAHDDPHSFR